MTQNLLFAGFSAITLITLLTVAHLYKKVSLSSVIGLFAFGALIASPFVLIEHMHLSHFYVIVAFLLIELIILFSERHIGYFHELIHHNIRTLRIASFLLIGFGFTYAEIGFSILQSTGDIIEFINTIPFKTTYALLMHTVFASAASLVQVGELLGEGLIVAAMRALTYYIRIGIISVSHYLYVFSLEHNLMLMIALILALGITTFFYIKHKLDIKPEAIE